MKKIIAIVSVIAVLCVVLSVTIFASDPSLGYFVSRDSVCPGESVTVTVCVLDCKSPSLGIIVYYDKDVFEMVSGEWLISGAAMSDFSDDCAVIAYSEPYDFYGEVFEFTLRAKEDAAIGEYSVNCNVEAESGEFEHVNPVRISVVCKEHSLGEYAVTTQPGCMTDGEETATCSVCGAKVARTLPATGHSYGEWEIKDATCTEAGSKERVCATCTEKESVVIPAKGHSFGEWEEDKEASTETEKVMKRACAVCGETETKTETVGSGKTEPALEPNPHTGETTAVLFIASVAAAGLIVLPFVKRRKVK